MFTIAIWLREESATYALLLLANAMPTGSSNCVTPFASSAWMVSTTEPKLVLVGSRSITLTLSERWFETQSSRPSGRSARLTGSMPTRTLRVIWNKGVATKLTVPDVVFAT